MLRALAVLCVVLVHLGVFFGVLHSQSIGQFALLLFFVHTTLVLMHSLERQDGGRGWRNLFNHFIVRRGFRLYPLSILIILAVLILEIPAASFQEGAFYGTAVGLPGLIANLLLVQNLTYTPSIVGQMWTLPIEFQMYLLLPSLFLFARRTASPLPLLLLWVAAVGFAIVQPSIAGRLGIAQFIPSFLPGVIAYRLGATTHPHWPAFLWPFFLAALAIAFVFSHPYEHGWLLTLLVGLVVMRFREIRAPWLRRAAHLVAKYSYGIYLTHLIAIWLGFLLLATLPVGGQWAVFVVTLVGLPLLLYHTVEAPLTRFGARLAHRWYPARVPPPRALPERDETTPLFADLSDPTPLPATAAK